MKSPVFLIISMIVIAGCVGQTEDNGSQPKQEIQTVHFLTADGWTLYADYYPSNNPAIILIHMLGGTRADWGSFAEELSRNFTVISIDMRGHGQSIQSPQGQRSYTSFNEQDWLSVQNDIAAAKSFLRSKGHDTTNIGIAGASIGANLALRYASKDGNSVKALALLSPGLDYRGIETADVIALYPNSIIFITSQNDPDSESASRILYNWVIADSAIKVYEKAGHGTEMFNETDLKALLIDWFEQKLG